MINEKGLDKNRIIFIALIVIAIFVAVSFIVLPVETDIKVFFGNAKLASQKPQFNWLLRPLKTWELKGIGNRTIFFCISALSSLFFKFSSVAFVIASKFIYIALATALIALLALLGKGSSRIKPLCIIMAILFMCGIECHMQAEMSGVIIMVVAYGIFAYKDKLLLSLLSGFVFGLAFFIKSATIIMIISFVALVIYYMNEKLGIKRLVKHIIIFGAGVVAIIAIGLLIIKMVYPTEIKDMLSASQFQTSIISGAGVSIKGLLIEFIKNFAKSAIRTLPMLIVMVATIVYGIIKCIRTKKKSMLWLLIAYIIPALYVIILNSFFSYHYYLFMFPLAIIASQQDKNERSPKGATIGLYVICGTTLVVYLALCSVVSPSNIRFIKAERKVEALNEKNLKKIKNENDKILYLDSGVGAYIMGKNSFSKYYYPLPVQRRKIVEEKQQPYHEMTKDIEDYNGKYITYEKTYMEKDNNLVSSNKGIKDLQNKYRHKIATVYYAPNINLFPSSEKDLIYNINIYEK